MGEHATKEGMSMEVVHVLVDIQVLIVHVLKEPTLLNVPLMSVHLVPMEQPAQTIVHA